MGRVTIEDSLKKVGSHFDLVLVAAERSKQIFGGRNSLVQKKSTKTHVTALREIEDGVLNINIVREGIVNRFSTIHSQAHDEVADVDSSILEELTGSDFIAGELEEVNEQTIEEIVANTEN